MMGREQYRTLRGVFFLNISTSLASLRWFRLKEMLMFVVRDKKDFSPLGALSVVANKLPELYLHVCVCVCLHAAKQHFSGWLTENRYIKRCL